MRINYNISSIIARNELNINNEFEKISKKCIDLENKQDTKLKELVNKLNKQFENDKKS